MVFDDNNLFQNISEHYLSSNPLRTRLNWDPSPVQIFINLSWDLLALKSLVAMSEKKSGEKFCLYLLFELSTSGFYQMRRVGKFLTKSHFLQFCNSFFWSWRYSRVCKSSRPLEEEKNIFVFICILFLSHLHPPHQSTTQEYNYYFCLLIFVTFLYLKEEE